jgi:hypothetical protein
MAVVFQCRPARLHPGLDDVAIRGLGDIAGDRKVVLWRLVPRVTPEALAERAREQGLRVAIHTCFASARRSDAVPTPKAPLLGSRLAIADDG